MLIAELLAASPTHEFYDAKVKVLSEMIKHHVKEEEKRSEGLFAQATRGRPRHGRAGRAHAWRARRS